MNNITAQAIIAENMGAVVMDISKQNCWEFLKCGMGLGGAEYGRCPTPLRTHPEIFSLLDRNCEV